MSYMGSSPQQHNGQQFTPEVLPPEGGYGSSHAPDSAPGRVRHAWWAAAPATYVLMGINIAVFVAMTLRGVGFWNPDTDRLLNWGADHTGLVLIYGEWRRVVTAMFVHVGILHLATNMWCLWNLGLLAEPLMGSFGVVAVYVLTGAAGNLLSILTNWWQGYHDFAPVLALYHGAPPLDQVLPYFPAGAGASGAVFGIAGALIVLLNPDRLPMAPRDELKKMRRSVITFAAINLILPWTVNFGAAAMHADLRIDNFAHIGGVACGLLFAVPMAPLPAVPRKLFDLRLRAAIGMVAGLLVLFGFYLAQLPR